MAYSDFERSLNKRTGPPDRRLILAAGAILLLLLTVFLGLYASGWGGTPSLPPGQGDARGEDVSKPRTPEP